jgi:hypothetical protein
MRFAVVLLLFNCSFSVSYAQIESEHDYLLLATNKTSTMQKEMQEAADQGYVFAGVMGGDTFFGGEEVVVVMKRSDEVTARYEYRLLATMKTSTLQNEMQEAGDSGFVYKGQSIFKTMFGLNEAVVILERDRDLVEVEIFEYRLLATKRSSTMQNELREVGIEGFEFVGVTVHQTTFGGDEVVAIMKRPVASSNVD